MFRKYIYTYAKVYYNPNRYEILEEKVWFSSPNKKLDKSMYESFEQGRTTKEYEVKVLSIIKQRSDVK